MSEYFCVIGRNENNKITLAQAASPEMTKDKVEEIVNSWKNNRPLHYSYEIINNKLLSEVLLFVQKQKEIKYDIGKREWEELCDKINDLEDEVIRCRHVIEDKLEEN